LTYDTTPAVRLTDIAKRYQSGPNQLVIFHHLSLNIPAAQRLALVGESGAGKSTLLHLLGGLDRPTEGRIEFDGVDITSLNETALADFRNRQIGFVWQTHYLLPEFTAAENVMMPLLIRGVRHSEASDRAHARLKEVGLAARSHHRAGELSGGEQQRVVIARALVGDPKVLLADEPTGNLDYGTGERIADLFDEIHRANGLTSVFVTHNIGFARRCDRILKLEQGLLREFDRDGSSVPGAPSAALQRGEVLDNTARGDGTKYV
jgi:lipoprotein-releasing system ATP-binding protein